MTKLSDIVNKLKQNGSTLAKLEILKSHKDDEDLQALFKGTLDSTINYYIRGSAITVNNDPFSFDDKVELTKDIINEVIETLNCRKVTGNKARAWIQGVANHLYSEDQVLLKKMLDGDLECKVSFGLVEKIWPELVDEYPVLLAQKSTPKNLEKFVKKTSGSKIIVQLKADGGRCNAVVENGRVDFFSRNGKALEMHGVFDEVLKDFEGYMVDGELLVLNGGKIENRQTGNGIFNKAVRGTITKDEAETFHFVVWDIVPIEDYKKRISDIPYSQRFIVLKSMVEANPHNLKLSLIETQYVDTIEEVQDVAADYMRRGFEGAVAKWEGLVWGNNRPSDMLKFKAELTNEFRCVGYKPHSKRPGWIGSLDFVTDDGKVAFNCGSGISDEDRQKDPDEFIGKVFEVTHNGLIKSKNSTIYKLFLPVKPRIRLDKDVTDKMEDCK